MAKKINLGKVGITTEGAYDSSKAYEKLSCVTYNHESWVSTKDVPAGNAPDNASPFWQKMSARGEQGIQGPAGPQGNSAFDGNGVEIVNNLTQGGEAAVLSAEQGKILKGELAELSVQTDAKLTELSEETSAKFERSAESVAERFEGVDTEIEQLKRGEAYVFGETLAFRNYADAMVQGNTLTL